MEYIKDMALIICEVGQNFCGNMHLAKILIESAEENGADLVKFQLYDHKKLYGDSSIPNVELSFDQARMLFNYGKEIGIEVFFSVFDIERVKWCEEMGVKKYKIGCSYKSREVFKAIGETNKECFVSRALGHNFWKQEERTLKNYRTLFCIPEYPTSLNNLHLEQIFFCDTHQEWGAAYYPFDGFSDHTIGLDAAKIALARGAQIIEKHFAINHQDGVDAKWSMTPGELRELKRWHDIVKEVL